MDPTTWNAYLILPRSGPKPIRRGSTSYTHTRLARHQAILEPSEVKHESMLDRFIYDENCVNHNVYSRDADEYNMDCEWIIVDADMAAVNELERFIKTNTCSKMLEAVLRDPWPPL